jgi:MBG domain (YGX type)/Bacterial Ig-like domain (group 3)/Galactose oxidase, central domain
MQTTPKANNILGHFFALLGAVVMLAIATWVSASSSEQVKPLDNLAVPRTGHTGTALSDGSILITGGRDADGNLVAAAEIFDPETQASSASATLHTARVDHSATVLADGRVLVAGGTGASGALSSAEIFDPANPGTGFQVVASPMTAARTQHTATLLNNGSVLIAGGETGGTAEIFDPTTQSFTPTLWNLQVARSGHTATLFTDDSVLLAGGNTASLEMFTPLDQKFTLDAAALSVIRTGHWAFELSDTRLLLFQGDTGNSIDEFNPTTDTLTPKGSLDFHASSSSLLANGKVLVLGTGVAGVYNPDAVPPAPDFTAFDETTMPGSGILPRSGQSAVTLPGDKKILITGGLDRNNQLLGQALFNPAKIWTDKDDYVPDEPVILSASGWKANEAIYLFAVDNETEQWTYEMTANADSNGEFVLSPYFIVELRHLGVQFHVTALGAQSTMQADVFFTDAGVANITVAAQTPSPVVAGNTASYTVTVHFNGNSNSCPVTLSASPMPAGASATFTTNPVTGQGGQDLPSTLSISTTAGTTLPNTYNFTITGTRGAACQGGGAEPTVATTLVVAAPAATTTAVTSSSNPSVYGNPVTFTATVSSTTTPTGSVNFNIAGIGIVAGTPGATTATTATWTYTTSASALTAGNHSVLASFTHTGSFGDSSGTLTGGQQVNQRPATWTTNAASKMYGDPDPAPLTTGSGSGFLVADGVTATYSRVAGESASPPTYHIIATLSPAGVLSNYSITNAGAEFTINKRPATWTTNNNSKTYGDPDPAPLTTGSGSGFLAADGVTATYSRVAGENASPPTYHITATLSATPASALNNYIITNAGANFTINAKDASVTPNAASKTYGAADPALTGTLTGFLAADGVTATYSRTPGETVAGSPYTISATLSPAGVLGNYNITYNTAEFTITPKDASVTPNAASKVYGAADPAFTGTLTGFLAGDGVTATYSRTTGETVAGSPYTISATLSPVGVLGNYSITYNTANFTITPAGLTITATNRSKVFGATYAPDTTSPSVDFSVNGLVTGDSVTSITLTCAGYPAAALPQPMGYTITPSGAVGAGLSNYNIGYVTGTLTFGYGTCTGPNGPGGVILQPIDADGSSIFPKAGRTVPVKFTLCDANGNPISDPNAVFAGTGGALTMLSAVRGQVPNPDESAFNDIPDVAFRYSSGIWIFNMATSNLQQNTTYTFRINLANGQGITFVIKIK